MVADIKIVGIPEGKTVEVFEARNHNKKIAEIWMDDGRMIREQHGAPSWWYADSVAYTGHHMLNDLMVGKLVAQYE